MDFLRFIVQGYICVGNRGLKKRVIIWTLRRKTARRGGIKKKLWALRYSSSGSSFSCCNDITLFCFVKVLSNGNATT